MKATTVNLRLKEALVAQRSTPKPLLKFLKSLNQHIMTVIPILGKTLLDVHNSHHHEVKLNIVLYLPCYNIYVCLYDFATINEIQLFIKEKKTNYNIYEI